MPLRAVSATCARLRVCVCISPLLKYFSHSHSIPNGAAGEQKPDQNAACASLNRLAASEGLSVTTAFPVSSNSNCSSFTVKMIWTNTVRCLYHALTVFFIIILCIILHIPFVSSSVLTSASGWSTKTTVFIWINVLDQNLCPMNIKTFLHVWPVDSHVGLIFVYSFPCNNKHHLSDTPSPRSAHFTCGYMTVGCEWFQFFTLSNSTVYQTLVFNELGHVHWFFLSFSTCMADQPVITIINNYFCFSQGLATVCLYVCVSMCDS